jgi:hypothetical protein
VCWLLRNMIAVKPHPFLAETPPLDGAPSDAALYYGGDEYSGPTDLSIRAAQFMRGLGLPYQTNIESDRHPMTAEEHARIRNLGTEVSAYYHLYEDDGFTMKPEHYRRQSDRFFERFGYRPVATVNHCIRWKGWTEPARWMLAAGGRADNGFSCKGVPNDNHFRNSASYGFSFGTCYPFYFWDDWRGGNERIDFMEQPIVCYELGHRGTTSVHRDLDSQAREEMHLALGMAIKNHFLMNMFYHPQPIVTMPNCREAIREVLRYVEYRGARVKHMNNRQAAEWWDARHASEVRGIVLSADALRFVCVSRWADGVTVKVPVPDGRRARVTVGGRQAAVEERIELGRAWCWFVAPAGESDIEVRFEE